IVAGGTYSTTFASSENPISEGGRWINGAAVGLDWNNVVTTNASDGVSRACGNVIVSGYNDPIAVYAGQTFNNHQLAQGPLYRASGYTPRGTYHEAELLLRFNISAHSASGYEVLFALNDPATSQDGYAVVRWNGPLGNYSTIYNGGSGSLPTIQNGDVFRVELS